MGQKAAHTPGPWRYCRENGSPTTGQHMIAGATPGYLAQVRDCGSGDVQANARLIAAAPDLLEIARAIVAVCDSGKHADMACMEGSPLVDAARDAIAKAEGGAA